MGLDLAVLDLSGSLLLMKLEGKLIELRFMVRIEQLHSLCASVDRLRRHLFRRKFHGKFSGSCCLFQCHIGAKPGIGGWV